MPTTRKATRRDAAALSLVAERTFRDTFGDQNTAENMDLHCRGSYGEQIQAREITSPNLTTLVAEDVGRLIGFAQIRWCSAIPCVCAQSPAEIQRLYVVQDWHGRGVAHDLMRACLEEIQGGGADAVWLGVWERNPRAISFYRKCGFIEVGEHIFPLVMIRNQTS